MKKTRAVKSRATVLLRATSQSARSSLVLWTTVQIQVPGYGPQRGTSFQSYKNRSHVHPPAIYPRAHSRESMCMWLCNVYPYACSWVSTCTWPCTDVNCHPEISYLLWAIVQNFVKNCGPESKIMLCYGPQHRIWFRVMGHSAEFRKSLWATVQNHWPEFRITRTSLKSFWHTLKQQWDKKLYTCT